MLQRFFFKQLMEEFPETKTIIIDRGEESEAALYDHCPPEIKLIEIVHADPVYLIVMYLVRLFGTIIMNMH